MILHSVSVSYEPFIIWSLPQSTYQYMFFISVVIHINICSSYQLLYISIYVLHISCYYAFSRNKNHTQWHHAIWNSQIIWNSQLIWNSKIMLMKNITIGFFGLRIITSIYKTYRKESVRLNIIGRKRCCFLCSHSSNLSIIIP